MGKSGWFELAAKAFVVLGILAILFIGFVCLLNSASGHEAPSGWHYPPNCCADQDCHPIYCESVTEKDGGYEWRGLHFTKAQTSLSGDGQCHACFTLYNQQPVNPRCLFLHNGS